MPVLSWSGVYVGKSPWLALAVLESLYIALLGWASALLQRAPSLAGRAPGPSARHRPAVGRAGGAAGPHPVRRVPLGPAGVQPGRLARWSASPRSAAPRRSPSRWRSPGPVAAAAVSRLGWVAPVAASAAPSGGRPVTGLGRALPVLVLAGALLLAPLLVPPRPTGSTARFMAVQGNVPRPGLDFNAERRAVLDNHVAVDPGRRRVGRRRRPSREPDLVVWPENSSDIDPLRNADAAAVINDAPSTAIGAPILVGAVLEGPGGAHLQRQPALPARTGASPRATSSSTRCRSPSTSRSGPSSGAQRQGRPGPRGLRRRHGRPCSGCPPRRAARSSAGPVICFEVAYDDLVRDTVRAGANVLLVQTNNATFGYTDESDQQLAMCRVRAVEHGRSIVHVSTVGVSALITPDGTAHQRTRVVHIGAARR